MKTKRIDFMSLIDKENTDEATVKLIQSLENKANEGLDNAIKGLDTKTNCKSVKMLSRS